MTARLHLPLLPLLISLLLCTLPMTAAADTDPFGDIAARTTRTLDSLLRLSDWQLQRLLQRDWSAVQNMLDDSSSPLQPFPVSRIYAGTRASCLRDHLLLTCKSHVSDRLQLQSTLPDASRVNPFQPLQR